MWDEEERLVDFDRLSADNFMETAKEMRRVQTPRITVRRVLYMAAGRRMGVRCDELWALKLAVLEADLRARA